MAFAHRLRRFAGKPRDRKLAAIQATFRGVFHVFSDTPLYARTAAHLMAQFHAHHTRVPKLLLHHGLAPGDDMMCTAVLRELRRRGETALGMVSDHPGLFLGSEDPTCVLPADGAYDLHRPPLSTYRHFARAMGGKFKRVEYAPFDGLDHSAVPSCHVIAEMCASVGITGSVAIRPYLTLTESEKAAAAWAQGRIVVHSSGMSARYPMGNKEWYAERLQGVVDSLAGEVEFIQVGSAADPALQNATDLRGSTNVRETAAVLHHARLFVGTVGFSMHLARAVECPSVIVYGGREAPWQSGYICNFNLYTQLPCAPCWRWNGCEFDRRCMHEIGTVDVVSAIRQMVERPRGPLEVETIVIGA